MLLEDLCVDVSLGKYVWCVKRLSANDVGLTGGHQAGVYLPGFFVRQAFGKAFEKGVQVQNPRQQVKYEVVGRPDAVFEPLSVIYYNNRFFGGTRNEYRITNWRRGNVWAYDEDDFNNVIFFAVPVGDPSRAVIYIARTPEEEEKLCDSLGIDALAPKDVITSEPDPKLKPLELPAAWYEDFPSSAEITSFVFTQLAPWHKGCDLDALLVRRRDLEKRAFDQVEHALAWKGIELGVTPSEIVLQRAMSIFNRRKSRTGKSLELNLEDIFRREQIRFTAQGRTELHKRPDFVFPSIEDYRNPDFPSERLYMMGAKTTCKDRWRQVLTEAERISSPYLFTLDTAISEFQYQEMEDAKVRLVMPQPMIPELHASIQGSVITLQDFVKFQRKVQAE